VSDGGNYLFSNCTCGWGINSHLISNAHGQIYAQDAPFKYKRGPMEEIGSGATLDQDKMFLAGGKPTDGDKIVVPRAN
jgi:hypothetical protein